MPNINPVAVPSLTSMVDTEQTVSREFNVGPADASFDMEIPYRRGLWRPQRVVLHYRVNKGATVPYWYLFSAKITVGLVLKDGGVSTAYANIRRENFYPEKLPVWVREMAAGLLPQTLPER